MAPDVDALSLLALGGGVAAAAALLTRRRQAEGSTFPGAVQDDPANDLIAQASTSAWVFPVPDLGDRQAEVSSGFGTPRTDPDGTKRKHLGADLMFKRRDARDLIAAYPPKTVNGTKRYFMPDDVPALAASAGTVRFAKKTSVGFTVIVRHPNGWATYYTHMTSVAVAKGDDVVAGQPVGVIGGNPLDGAHLKHLHFELWKHGTRAGVVDPEPYLDAWTRSPAGPRPSRSRSATPGWSTEPSAIAATRTRRGSGVCAASPACTSSARPVARSSTWGSRRPAGSTKRRHVIFRKCAMKLRRFR